MNAPTSFTTGNAGRYPGTHCTHIGHKVSVQLEPGVDWINPPFGQCTRRATGRAALGKIGGHVPRKIGGAEADWLRAGAAST